MTLDANLNADIFRSVILNGANHSNKYFLHDLLEINDDNTVLLCSNDIVSRFQNGLLSLYKSPEDLLKQNVLTSLKEEVTSSAAAFINSNLIFVAEDSGVMKLHTTDSYDGKNGKLRTVSKTSAHQDIVNSVIKLTGSTNCVTAGNDLEIKIWDTDYLQDRFAAIHSFYPAHRDFITDLTVNDCEVNTFGSCSNDHISFLWDLRKSTPATGLFKSEHGLKCINWQPESNVVALGDCDGTIFLVDTRYPGAVFKKIPCFTAELHKIEFCPSNTKLLAVCADDTAVKVIDIEKDNPDCIIYEENSHTGLVRGLAWNRESQELYTCGYDNKLVTHSIEL
ncbi:methylosome protein 50-like [Ctenocephalides felis]|uniref:methylosome protein 50-like n=1 Tax=Ctenocephalides felis TaxID=7515 RepID=UPI000E6E1A76|nr:methylosome protein 50-like [Ctenocephalides felis]